MKRILQKALNETDEVSKLYTTEKKDLLFLAPNGKPSKLAPENWLLVRTESFKRWFGDWENDPENSSKVVDDNGEPMLVYHGSPNLFDKFEKGSNKKFGVYQDFGDWHWFSECRDVACTYRASQDEKIGPIYECFLNLRKPFISEEKAVNMRELLGEEEFNDDSKDGLIVHNIWDFAVSPHLNRVSQKSSRNKQLCGFTEDYSISRSEYYALSFEERKKYEVVTTKAHHRNEYATKRTISEQEFFLLPKRRRKNYRFTNHCYAFRKVNSHQLHTSFAVRSDDQILIVYVDIAKEYD